jgi:hypothetical protein
MHKYVWIQLTDGMAQGGGLPLNENYETDLKLIPNFPRQRPEGHHSIDFPYNSRPVMSFPSAHNT